MALQTCGGARVVELFLNHTGVGDDAVNINLFNRESGGDNTFLWKCERLWTMMCPEQKLTANVPALCLF